MWNETLDQVPVRRLAAARRQTRQLVETASVLGHFDVRYAAVMMRLTVAELLPAVHEALAIGALVEDGRQLALTDHGRHPARLTGRPTFGWDSLTRAELRIARLAAEGLTNQQMADRLALSRHTVESHVRHVFRKLDIRSRVELTRLVMTHEPAVKGLGG
ncbi:helix-turn-helix transcriptional regulator [Kribbella sp. NPDC056861]|uniref:helix-turn-helix transcriptional regulator n=1 Tax=Kribbella sp. NPDC056861 TaxID=3154857 RepID=UPI00342C2889